MRILIKIFLIAICNYLVQMQFPWYMVVLSPLFTNVFVKGDGKGAFWSGFIGIALVWSYMIISIDSANESILADKIAQLFFLPNSTLFIIVNILIGALIGGWSGVTGRSLRRLFERKKTLYY